jgi:hypothetical protein
MTTMINKSIAVLILAFGSTSALAVEKETVTVIQDVPFHALQGRTC